MSGDSLMSLLACNRRTQFGSYGVFVVFCRSSTLLGDSVCASLACNQAKTSARAKLNPAWSLADSCGVSPWGQLMPMAGSFHAMQRSWAGA